MGLWVVILRGARSSPYEDVQQFLQEHLSIGKILSLECGITPRWLNMCLQVDLGLTVT